MVSGSVSILPVFLSLICRVSPAPQLSLVPLRISLRHQEQSGKFNIVRPFTPIRQFFPTVVQTTHFLECESSSSPLEKTRRVVKLETRKIPFSLLEDMRREMFHSEAAKIIEKGSNFVQALRYRLFCFFYKRFYFSNKNFAFQS